MKSFVFSILIFVSAATLTFANDGYSADGILANDTGFLPTITVNDTHAEKFVRDQDKNWNVNSTERLTATIIANLAGFDFSELTADMTVNVQIGDFDFWGVLSAISQDARGNPIDFTTNMTSGVYIYWTPKLDKWGNEMQDKDGNPIMVNVGSLKFAWTATRLTINISISDTCRAGVSSPINTLNLLGLADDGHLTASLNYANEAVPVRVAFGSAEGDRLIYAKGKTSTIHKIISGDDYAANSATLTAGADIKVPMIRTTLPVDDGGNSTIDFEGTVTDLASGTLPSSQSIPVIDVEAYVNDSDFASPIPADDVSDPDVTGKHAFSFTSLPLYPGTNTVVIVATDDSGNQKTYTDTVVSTQEVGLQKRRH